MNPKGNHPLFPKHPDGTRDLDTEWSHVKAWKELEKLVKTGKTKAIGVSNYSVKYLEELLPHCEVVPAVNQIENHPYLPQQDIVDFCNEKKILIEAYSPLGSTGSPLFKEEGVQKVAKKHDVGPGTVLISYQGKHQVSHRSRHATISAPPRWSRSCAASPASCTRPYCRRRGCLHRLPAFASGPVRAF